MSVVCRHHGFLLDAFSGGTASGGGIDFLRCFHCEAKRTADGKVSWPAQCEGCRFARISQRTHGCTLPSELCIADARLCAAAAAVLCTTNSLTRGDCDLALAVRLRRLWSSQHLNRGQGLGRSGRHRLDSTSSSSSCVNHLHAVVARRLCDIRLRHRHPSDVQRRRFHCWHRGDGMGQHRKYSRD